MKMRNLALAFAGGWFTIAFLRNGTATKGARQATRLANTLVGGTAKMSRKL